MSLLPLFRSTSICGYHTSRAIFYSVGAVICQTLSLCQSLTTRSESPTTVGRNFELVTVRTLKEYGFDVKACGGPKDRGVDFRGVWRLANYPELSVVGQCKRYKIRLGPRYVRELEGVLSHEHENTLGLLVTELGYTKDAYQALMSSQYPIILSAMVKNDNEASYLYDPDEENSATAFEDSCLVSKKTSTEDLTLEENSHKYNTDLVDDLELELKHNMNCPSPGKFAVRDSLGCKETTYPVHVSTEIPCELNALQKPGQSENHKHDFSFSRIVLIEHDNSDKDVIIDTVEKNTECDVDNRCEEPVVFSMFEMNHRARQLLPFLIIGTKYDEKRSRIPELMVIQGDDIYHIKK